jgi:hypothetical protein
VSKVFIFRAFLAIFAIARYQKKSRGNNEMFPLRFPTRGVFPYEVERCERRTS